jgi:hypothetical protein
MNIEKQKARVIELVLAKAIRFIENNSNIIETLVSDLLAEKMFEAVKAICKHHLEIGNDKKNDRMVAFASLTLGELFAKEFDPELA